MKKIFIYMLIIFLVIVIPTTARAGTMDNVINSGDDFLNSADDNFLTVNEVKLQEVSRDMYSILLYAGVVLSVIIIAIMGIQFMVASAEDKAKVKEAMIPYIVGCVVIFGAFGFWKMAVILFNSI